MPLEEATCAGCSLPLERLAIQGETDWCQACRAMIEAAWANRWLRACHDDWLVEELRKRRLRSGGDYFGG